MRKFIQFVLALILTVPIVAQDGHELIDPDLISYLNVIPLIANNGGSEIEITIRHELERFGDLGGAPFAAVASVIPKVLMI